MDAAWRRLTGGAPVEAVTLDIKGRTLPAPVTAQGAARFSFSELCARPLGASDYLALARAFHTLLVEDVPVMTYASRNEAKTLHYADRCAVRAQHQAGDLCRR